MPKENVKADARTAGVVLAVIVIVVAAYAFFPYVAATRIADLNTGSTAYVYGVVKGRTSLGGINVFSVSDSTGSIYVSWNGSLPAVGSHVLVHGTVKSFLGEKYLIADSVVPWYLAV
jgi:cytochrome c-type biogenesis protein CcmE